MSVEETVALALWVESLSEAECRGLLHFLCGYRPELLAMLKAEREDTP